MEPGVEGGGALNGSERASSCVLVDGGTIGGVQHSTVGEIVGGVANVSH